MNQNTTPEKKCCPACEGFESKGEESWTYCQKSFVGCCHTTQQEAWREEAIKAMADRFLRWKLPIAFHPDNGISFESVGNEGTQWEYRREPVGTNLFSAEQATEMVRFMSEGVLEETRQQAVADDRKELREKVEGITVGEFTIRPSRDYPDGSKSVWIEEASGEGGQFAVGSFEKVIRRFYDENF